jgi:cation transport regulator ChaB
MSGPYIDLSRAPVGQPQYQPFQLPALYRVAADGKVWVWVIGFDGEQIYTNYERLENAQRGSYQTSRKRVDLNTTGRNLYEQALLEAQSDYKKKKDKENYSEQIIAHDIYDQQAMLATKWEPDKNQIKPGDFPVYVQVKIDGVRCRAHHVEGQGIILMSRGKQIIHFLDHVRYEVAYFISAVIEVLKTNFPQMSHMIRTDGELFCPNKKLISFDALNGISRLERGASPLERNILYYIFDLVFAQDMEYRIRHLILTTAYNFYLTERKKDPNFYHCIIAVPVEQANNKQDILNALQRYLTMGYEGIMIRRITGDRSYYKPGRSTHLYKYKLFEDEEGKVVGAYTGKGKEEGAVIWQVQRPSGEMLNVHPEGAIDERKQIWIAYNQNPNAFLGQKYRYKFQEPTESQKVRFPVGLGFIYDR